eukprot:GILI01003401.1.p1 GENE.GILI01003401.1~~GILI01003401.1.p1  ORF type:complete len:667 (+),score=186.21 GILI01003401.1:140-2140(+)
MSTLTPRSSIFAQTASSTFSPRNPTQTGLPKLPGYEFNDPLQQKFHRPQFFDFKNGLSIEKSIASNAAEPEITEAMLQSLSSPRVFQTTTPRGTSTRGATTRSPRILPQWMKHDREVLRFFAYFQEPVYDSALENFRVRKCVVYYYLEDDTMQILEPKVENSGMSQGVFVRRHKFPKNTSPSASLSSSTFSSSSSAPVYVWGDLNIGVELSLYGRTFRIVSVDDFTRRFLEGHGHQVPVELDYPSDSVAQNTLRQTQLLTNAKLVSDAGEIKEYMEVKHGGGKHNKNLQKLLEFDRMVLRFFVTWEDTSLFGTKNEYVLRYFLVDDTVEMQEVYPSNCGRDPFPLLLRRQKVPLEPAFEHTPAHSIRNLAFLQPSHLRVGEYVNLYTRSVFVHDCDQFTRRWYRDNLQMDQGAIIETPKAAPVSRLPIPPHTGFGSEEDSISSCFTLQPKPPRKDIKKILDFAGQLLRFEARVQSGRPEDNSRQFIVVFYLADDTISVWEKTLRNSGIWSGKFLERQKWVNPDTRKPYHYADIFIGSVLNISSHQFRVVGADEYTLRFMEGTPEAFPMADISFVLDKLKQVVSFHTTSVTAWFRHMDRDKNCLISHDEFRAGLRERQIDLTEQEYVTLFRHFDKNGSGSIDLQEFTSTLDPQWSAPENPHNYADRR